MKLSARAAGRRRRRYATSYFLLADSPPFLVKRNKNIRADVGSKESKTTPRIPSHGAGAGAGGVGGVGGIGVRRKKSSKKRKVSYSLRRLKQMVPVAGIDYVMELSLTDEKIFEIGRNRIKRNDEPKFQVKTNKAQDLKDEFNSYCGEKKKIKNWLYYV